MSAFTTILSCDMRTAPDRRSAEYAEVGTGTPRWTTGRRNGWAACLVPGELAVRQAADAVASQPMQGTSGDHPEKREHIAAVLNACADAVRLLGRDHTGNSHVSPEDWEGRLQAIREALDTVTV
jgi:hypothetical protein